MLLGYIGINGRKDIPRHLNEMGLTGYGAEIGTHKGEFAKYVLSHWRGRHLFCIDPYEKAENYDPSVNNMETDREHHKAAALAVTRSFYPRADLLHESSEEAAKRFQQHALDFVYLDGDHSLAAVKKDLNTWWPLLKPGGLLLGHDFICPGERDGGWGAYVQLALRDFCNTNQMLSLEVCPIPEMDGSPWSFAVRKPL